MDRKIEQIDAIEKRVIYLAQVSIAYFKTPKSSPEVYYPVFTVRSIYPICASDNIEASYSASRFYY